MKEHELKQTSNSLVNNNEHDYNVKSNNQKNIGQFSFFNAPISNTVPISIINLEELHKLLTSSKDLRNDTMLIRHTLSHKGKKEYSQQKTAKLPFATISGVFSKRSAKSLNSHSGLICIDVDDLENHDKAKHLKELLIQDKQLLTTMVFISPSGKGLKIIYKISSEVSKHKIIFDGISNYLISKYKINSDSSCSDVSRACFLCYDREAYLNPQHSDIVPFDNSLILEESEQVEEIQDDKLLSEHEINSHYSTLSTYAIKLEKDGLCITEAYHDWLKIGLSLCHLGEQGRDLFHLFSRTSKKYDKQVCNDKFDDLLVNYDGRMTIGTIYHYLKGTKIDVTKIPLQSKIRTATKRLEDAKHLPDILMQLGVIWMNGELHVLFGDTGCGKSVFAVQVADALSKGKGVFNVLQNEHQKQKILLYDFELSDKQFFKRYTDENGKPFPFDENLVFGEIDFKEPLLNNDKIPMDKYIIKRLKEDIQQFKPQILIVDNITFLTTQTAQDTSVALELMRELDNLKKEYGISILVLAHTPKVRSGSPLTLNELGGSKHLSNFADSVSCIGKSSKGNNVRYIKQVKASRSAELIFGGDNVITVELNKHGSRLGFDYIDCNYETDHLSLGASERKDDWHDTVLMMHEEGITVRGIADKTGVPKSTVGRWINNKGEIN